MVIFAMGISAAQQLRVAATDMYPPRHARAGAGLRRHRLAGRHCAEPAGDGLADDRGAAHRPRRASALPWLMLPVLILGGMMLVTFVRPDPKEIGMHLERYYPDYVPPPKLAGGQDARVQLAGTCCACAPTRLAILSNCAGQGNMAIVMVLTSLVLVASRPFADRDRVLPLFHAAGMFAFTIPLGWASDRYRPRVGDVSGRRHGAGWRAVRRLRRGLRRRSRSARSWSGSAGRAANVASTALIADYVETAASRPRHRRERKRRRRDDAAGGAS